MENRHGTTDDVDSERWRRELYQPLKKQTKEIRILKLSPATNIGDDPEGELYTIQLEEANFAAISYLWGDPKEQRSMILNGRLIKIGLNAHTTLRYLRKRSIALHLWQDAICINQKDDIEKAQQVALMKDIYSLARKVYIWTGLGFKYALFSFDLAMKMDTIIHAPPPADPVSQQQASWDLMKNVTEADWQHLITFLEIPLWRRIWILQEMLLSSPLRRKAVLVAGKTELNHYFFLSGVSSIVLLARVVDHDQKWRPLHALLSKVIMSGSRVIQPFISWRIHGTIPVNTLVSVVGDMEATNPKDLVYGLLGLLPYISPSPDYRKTLAQIYIEATYAILAHSQSLHFILSMSHHSGELKDGIPSWAVDWRQKTDRNFIERWSELSIAYNACNGQPARLELQEGRLGVTGLVLFTVEASGLGPISDFDYETIKSPSAQHRFVYGKLGSGEYLGLNEHSLSIQDFCRVLLLDLQPPITDSAKGIMRLEVHGNFMESLGALAAYEILSGSGPGRENIQRSARHLAVVRRLWHRLRNTRISFSPTGQLCIVPEKAQAGDVVCILGGSSVPFVLRPVSIEADQPTYQVIGGAYVHGVMDGEAVIDAAPAGSDSARETRSTIFQDLWLV